VLKGSQVFVDAYSGFVDNQGEYRSELEPLLRGENIEALFICGLALDICVAATARDAAKLGFLTAIVIDCSKGLTHEQIEATGKELTDLNAAMIDSKEVEQFIDSRKLPWRWIKQIANANRREEEDGANALKIMPKPLSKRLSHPIDGKENVKELDAMECEKENAVGIAV